MKILRQPKVYLVARSGLDDVAVRQFLDDEATTWTTDGDQGTELLSELAGRVCYMSFGEKQGRKSNRDYLENIIRMEHGSVLEHAVWSFIVTGVSRSFTHELIRHRAGWAYCLAGDTLVYSEHRNKGKRDGPTKRRIDHLYEMTKTPHGRSRLRLLRLRCFDEVSGTFTVGTVKRVSYSGAKPVFRIRLDDGKEITCTKDHRFLTPAGWKSLDAIVGGLAISTSGIAMYGNTETELLVNGIPVYRDREWLHEHYVRKNLDQRTIAALAGVSHHTIRSWIRKHALQKSLGSWSIGVAPWNKGKQYHAGWHHSSETRALLRAAKVGAKNPQWKGGVTRRAVEIRRPITSLRPLVLDRDGFRCRLCGRKGLLTVHHVLPIWARPDLAHDLDNLVALCRPCHRRVNGNEEQYASTFGREIHEIGDQPRARSGGRLLAPQRRRIVDITFVGEQDTYDIEMDGPNHNFVANGFVTHNSQLSQRYVDESDSAFVVPEIIASDSELFDVWGKSVRDSHEAYCRLAEGLTAKIERESPELKRRDKRKRAREAARSVLPNATETKILLSANARALRHFVEYRGAPDAEPEIRRVATLILDIMRNEAPNIFGDYQTENHSDGSRSVVTDHKKV